MCSCTPADNESAEPREIDQASREEPRSISAQFDSIGKKAVAAGIIEGIQFALVENGQILSTQAFGLADRERKVAMTADTPINVASVSKSLTAWGMSAYIERNGLELDASVRQLLNDGELYDEMFPGVDVSIGMLLSHTSGLSGASVPVTPASRPMPGIVDILLGKSSVPRPRLQHAPGSGYLYSGAGYLVLQKIIEDATGRDFAGFMADTVLRPAQMPDSTFALTPRLLSGVAIYYRADGRRRETYHLPGAAGGLCSTASDMAHFLTLYTSHGQDIRSRIISDEGYAALLNPVVVANIPESQIDKIQYALGHYTYVSAEGAKIVFHGGGNPGLRAVFVVAPDRGIGFFAAANNDNGSEILAGMLSTWGRYYGLTMHEHF